jgi:hypothetical protein
VFIINAEEQAVLTPVKASSLSSPGSDVPESSICDAMGSSALLKRFDGPADPVLCVEKPVISWWSSAVSADVGLEITVPKSSAANRE